MSDPVQNNDPYADYDISVIIATYNRAKMLRETLENMVAVDREGLSVQWVVIDNGSGDGTAEVVRSFADRLPIRYLLQTRPGKNCALNLALDTVKLGRVVVFTDDDVLPEAGWLKAIQASADDWPEISVFGGGINPVWPVRQAPFWVKDPFIAGVFYGWLDLGREERLFPQGRYPAGANLWVRREVFADGLRYDETFGPHHYEYFSASESSLLDQLARKGHDILYVPSAMIGHCIRQDQLSMDYLRQRTWQCGRTGPRMNGLSLRHCHQRWPGLWRVLRWGSLARYALKYGLLRCSPFRQHRVTGVVKGLWGVADNLEQLRIAREEASRRVASSRSQGIEGCGQGAVRFDKAGRR